MLYYGEQKASFTFGKCLDNYALTKGGWTDSGQMSVFMDERVNGLKDGGKE